MQQRKQHLFIILYLALLVFLAGCLHTDEDSAEITILPTATTFPIETVPDIPETNSEQTLPVMPICSYAVNYLFYDEKETEKVQIQSYFVEEYEDYYHFSVTYTATEDLCIEGYLCTEDTSDSFLTPGMRTKTGENILQFEIPKEKIDEYVEMDIFFVPETAENISLAVHFPMRVQMTNGTPAEKAARPGYLLRKAWKSDQYQIHDCYIQRMDNGFIRYTLDMTLPNRAYFSVYVIHNEEAESVLQLLTVKGRQQYMFDIAADKLQRSREVTVLIKEESSSYENLVSIPSSFLTACTDGNPVNDSRLLECYAQKGNPTCQLNSCAIQMLDNNHYRYTLNYTAPEGVRCSVFDPPNGEHVSLQFVSHESAEENQFVFDLNSEIAANIQEFTIMIGNSSSNVVKNNTNP